MATLVQTWLNFALQQMAAEAYLDQFLSGERSLINVLSNGNNNEDVISLDQFTGATRFVDLAAVTNASQILGSAQSFASRYQIVDHHADDASGFSATLMRERDENGQLTNNYTLSFRSLEFKGRVEGGDWERDGRNASGLTSAASGEIAFNGFAFAQLMSMEQYFKNLQLGMKSNGTIDPALQAFFADPNNRINLTGYSLGGHLATVFAELHASQVEYAYIFNGSGRGRVDGFTGTDETTLSNESLRIDAMLDRFNEILFDPERGITKASDRDVQVYQAAQALHDANSMWDPFQSGSNENIYLDPRYQWAKLATLFEFGTVGTASLEIQTGLRGIAVDQGPDPKIIQIYGLAATDDANFVANSGLYYGPAQPVLIEGQPLLAGQLGVVPHFDESGSSHSLTLIVDSLAVQELIQTIDSRYGQMSSELLIKAASNERAQNGVAPLDTPGVAESDSLEKTVDALRKFFRDPALPPFAPLASDSKVGGFGNLANRNSMYNAMDEIRQAVKGWQDAGVTFRLDDLTDVSLLPSTDPASPENVAHTDTARGLAYRYALKELNPFALYATDDLVTDVIYEPHNTVGELDLFNPTDGTGTITANYLLDRSLFLAEKLVLNLNDRQAADSSIHFADYAPNGELSYELPLKGQAAKEYLFGSYDLDRLEGSSNEDHLYGGGGVDLLIGNGGDDYLQGDGDGDQLEGDDGTDTLVGGQGYDLLEGGTGNDILDGGLDDDTLKGGDGVDTYIIRASDGADTIEDSDGKGVVEFDGQVLGGALHHQGDPQNVYRSADQTITFTKQGNDLVVTGSGPLTIENFTNGEFGIRLVDLPAFGDATRTGFDKIDHYVQVGNNPDGSPIYDPVYAPFFDNNANDTRTTANSGGLVPAIGDENNLIHALGGDDYIFSGAGDDQLYGDAGIDQIYGGRGNDRFFGGTDGDFLYGDDGTNSTSGGNDYLDGGDGNDFLQGGAGRDILLGGAGDDLMSGDETAGSDPGASDNSGAFDDWLDGGSGNDILHGGSGSDVLIGGADNDWLIGDATQYQNGRPEQGGKDVLDGGTGDDELDGLYGNDLLLGGGGKDLLNGQDGSDVLYGGDDNDILSGDLRIQSVGVGQYVYDTNEYRAAGGDDLLLGEDGNDIMIGGEGNDTLEGDTGDDSLFGAYNTAIVSSSDPLYWTLFTAPGNDSLDAGAGNDGLHGGIGADSLLGEDGNDLLYGGGGDDVLEGGTGDDQLYGDYFPGEFNGNPFLSQITGLAGNNQLDGGDGNDDLYGGDLVDTLIGGAGNDRLFGGRGVDVLIGGEGDDRIVDDDPTAPSVGDNETLDGSAGNDYLESWRGDDVLLGGAGNDTLVSHAGKDQLFGDEGNDRLIWDIISEEGDHPTTGTSAQILYGGTGDDVYEIKAAGTDAMEFANEGTDLVINSADEIYTLPDNIENLNTGGTGIGNSLDNIITATIAAEGRDGNDTLISSGRLDGGVGDDLLIGGSRLYMYSAPPPPLGGLELPPPSPTIITNTYIFGPGYGHDTIQEMDPEFNSAYYQNEDTVQFLSGIAPSDVTWQRQGNDLELSVNGGADRLTVESFYDLSFNIGGYNVNGLWVPPQGFERTTFAGFPSYYAHSRVESFTFSDGATWGADHFGAPLLGDFRADTYQFGIGAGDETVIDFDFSMQNAPGKEVDHVDIGPDVSPSNLSVSIKNGADLVLSIDGTEDSFTVQSFLTSVVVFAPFSSFGYVTLPYQIEEVRFDDGTTWSVSDLYNRISTISGTANADSLNGNSGNNLIQGLAGNDSLSGGGGNDVLDGGAGNDYLEGGSGSDTYLFGRGGGQDTVRSEDFTGSDLDLVRLGVDLLPSDVTIRAGGGGDDLIVQINGSSDQLSLYRFISGPFYQIDQLIFGDGTVWDTSTIMANAQGSILTGTDGSDTLRGSVLSDVLSGLDGDDVLVGFDGNDRLIGGTGDDALDGGAGNDIYVFNRGDGVDTVFDTAVSGEGNRIQFGDGIAPSDLSFERIDTWLYVHVGTGDDTIRLRNFDPTGVNGSVVTQTLRFSDGSTYNLVDLLNPPVNHAPTVTSPLADQNVPEDAPFSIQVPANTFADPDASDTLTYSATQADGSALPSWLNFNATTRTFTGTPDDTQVGTLNLAVKATDGGGLSATSSFALTVQNVNEAPTVANQLVNQTVQEDTTFNIQLPANTFADPDAGDTLTYIATQADGSALPTWLSFNPTTRTFTGTPDDAQVGTLNVTVKTTDSGSLSVTSAFALTVQNVNEAPTVAAPLADQQGTQGAVFSLVVPTTTFADVDPGDTLTYSATQADGSALPTWLSFNPTTHTFTGTPQAGDVGTLNVRVTATDSGLLSAADVFAMTIAPSGGTAGNDTLTGTSGNDLLDGLAGDDVLQGLAGNDTLLGGAGNDLLDGGTGADTMTGGTGNDTYVVDNAGDVVTENANEGTDTVQSSITYTLGANVENLTLVGTAAINGTGNALNNILIGNSAANVLTGGAGNDTYYIGAGDTVVEQANQGTDTVFTDQSYTLGANVENLTLTGTANLNGTGNTLNNVLSGNSGDNILDGGTGVDTLSGGLGNDTYVVDNAGDVVTENANEGTDTVQSSLTYTLGASVENLTLTGTAAINGTGNALDNVLTGNSANNTLSGGAGNDRLDGGAGSDTMIGGTGDDTYVVNQVSDVVTENAKEGTDTVESSIAYTLGSNLENLTLTGAANLVATGNTLNNIMIGNSGANAMDGGSGNDTLDGGASNDTISGGSGDDTVLGGLGDDVLSGGSGNDVLDGGDGTDTLDGGSENDILRAGAGNDTISGGSGADQLTGGTGNDTLAGGSGNDLYNFARGDGQDTISDSDATQGNQDKLLFGTTINPLDLVISRQANDLRLAIHGTTDSITVKNWYTSPTTNQIEDLLAGNGQHLLNTQVDQLIQAMASFSQQTGLTWDQAIDQRPQQVQTVLAASWH